MGTTECTRLPSLLVSGEERHADPVAVNCHLTNRVAVVTSQAVRENGGLRPTVISTIKRAESVLFSDFCGCGPPSVFIFEIPLRQSRMVRRAGRQACPPSASWTHEAESRAWHSCDYSMRRHST